MLRSTVRMILPFGFRLEFIRLVGLPRRLLERHSGSFARERVTPEIRATFGHLLARHTSPLRRGATVSPPDLQKGKERNVTLVASMLDGLIIEPFQVFSYHRSVGRPSRLRGFVDGLELRDEHPVASIGGGLCQVSNGIHWVAVNAGMRIVERHRHGLDLFPDDQRTVPFGAGATVVYDYADLRIENPLSQSVMLATRVENATFVAEMWATRDPGWTVDVYEPDDHFFRQDGVWFRENHIRRRITLEDGTVLTDQEVAHNVARVLYEPGTQAS